MLITWLHLHCMQMIKQCGKMALLARLLDRLHAAGHKVLIFSQVCLSHAVQFIGGPTASFRHACTCFKAWQPGLPVLTTSSRQLSCCQDMHGCGHA